MPHQCLKCGLVYEEGSPQLLKGCSECGGNRFFFTKEPLDEKQRNNKMEEVGQDLNTAIYELMKNQNIDNKIDDKTKWPDIKPKDLRKAIHSKTARMFKKKLQDSLKS